MGRLTSQRIGNLCGWGPLGAALGLGTWGPGFLAQGELRLLMGLAGVYCYRVNRRLFPVPVDPGTPCRLCRTPRDQQGPGTLAQPAQVR